MSARTPEPRPLPIYRDMETGALVVVGQCPETKELLTFPAGNFWNGPDVDDEHPSRQMGIWPAADFGKRFVFISARSTSFPK